MASPLAGLGSNIDVNSLVAGLMEVERAPLRAISAKNAQYQANLSAFGTAKGALSGVQTASRALADAMTSIPATVTTSAPAVASATALAGTTPANFSLSVQSLAQAHRIYTGAFPTADTVVGSGAIAIDRGSFDGTTFTANTGQRHAERHPRRHQQCQRGRHRLGGQ
jgi:flagellar hook-associated protein 2